MQTAKDAEALRKRLKAEGAGRAEIIQALTACCLGWPYVFGASGQDCAPAQRNKYAGYRPDHAAAIRSACPVLSEKAVSCDTCDWRGTLIDDCRGFTRLMLEWAGLSLYGGTVTAQWEYGPNWVKKGPIEEMPRGLVCCVFREGHTGMYVGDDLTRHCGGKKGQVVEEPLPGNPKWLRYGIPSGLYSNEELRKAGVDFDESKNIPTLRRGSVGDEVEELQVLLNAKYGFNLDIDGIFGAKTESAVKAFQKAHGLTADGVVGPKTRKALGFYPVDKPVDNDDNALDNAPDNPENGGFDTGINVPDNSAENISTAHIIWDRLMRAIGNPYGVAGLMGNLQAESSLNPENLQNTGNRALELSDAEYTAAVDTGKYTAEQFIHDGYGYGLAQWTYYSRKANLLNFAVGKGCSIGDLDTQINFLLAEMRLHYSGVLDTLETAADVREASDAVLLKYERPKNMTEENQVRRAKIGQEFFDRFADVDNMPETKPGDAVTVDRTTLKALYAQAAAMAGTLKKIIEGE